MNYIEYGKENSEVIVLLHGGGLSWWNYKEAAELLCEKYRVVLPVLDGHAGCDKAFTTIESNAADIIDFIDEHFGGKVMMIGGLSLGGQILLEILSERNDICRYALIESALVLPSKMTYAMIEPAFGSCYGLIKQRWFSKLQFKSLRIKPELFEDYYRDTCAVSKEDLIAFMKANSMYSLKDSIAACRAAAYIFIGGKENRAMRTSAKLVNQKLSGSMLTVMPKMYHGEFSVNHAADYADTVRKIIEQE